MATEHKPSLTSAEIGILWNEYLADTISICIEKFHVAKEQDKQARAILQDATSSMEKKVRPDSSNVPK